MKEVRQTGNKPKNECSLQGCHEKKITLRLTTYHDAGHKDRDAQFCSDAHCATWVLSYAIREVANWKDHTPSQRVVDDIESTVEAIIDDPDLRKD